MNENWRDEDESRYIKKHEMVCKNCKKKFTTGNPLHAYCSQKCNVDLQKKRKIQSSIPENK